MKRIFNRRSIMLTIVLLLGAIPAMAIERPIVLKPFSLNGMGIASFVTDDAGTVVGANVTAAGTATHLGLWTAVGSVRFVPENGRIRSVGVATITAANGDKLEAVSEGALDPETGIDQGVFRFVGGTGRFEGVSGSANFVVSINQPNGGFELTLVGKIRF